MIQKETLSHRGQTDISKFLELHEEMENLFPKMFLRSKSEDLPLNLTRFSQTK